MTPLDEATIEGQSAFAANQTREDRMHGQSKDSAHILPSLGERDMNNR